MTTKPIYLYAILPVLAVFCAYVLGYARGMDLAAHEIQADHEQMSYHIAECLNGKPVLVDDAVLTCRITPRRVKA